MLPGQAGVQGRPKPDGVQGDEAPPPRNFAIRVVHKKWCDMWKKWIVQLELLPTTFLPTEADTTHRMK
mgnify:FL=1